MTFCEMHKNNGGCQECPNRYVCKDSPLKTKGDWGGAREGAGRPASGRKRQSFYITDEENQLLREHLEKLREEKQ